MGKDKEELGIWFLFFSCGKYSSICSGVKQWNEEVATVKILVIGGTRFFGIHMVNALLEAGHDVTIATRGLAGDAYGDKVKRIILERTDADSVKNAICGIHYDVVIDKIAYCSNDIKSVMDVVDCDKYIHMSSAAVYEPLHIDCREEDFDAESETLIWCDRDDFPYDEVKRQAECALAQVYSDRNWIAVRYPFVLGEDDYTERLHFYVEHIMKSISMDIDNLEAQMGYIHSKEAGKFMAFLAEQDFNGPINGCANGTISVKEIIQYIEEKTGSKAIISPEGDTAPYNGAPDYSINTRKAEKLGFSFSNLNDWIFELVDYYIDRIMEA